MQLSVALEIRRERGSVVSYLVDAFYPSGTRLFDSRIAFVRVDRISAWRCREIIGPQMMIEVKCFCWLLFIQEFDMQSFVAADRP